MKNTATVRLNVISKTNFTLLFPDGVCGFANTRRGAMRVVRQWAKAKGVKTTQMEETK